MFFVICIEKKSWEYTMERSVEAFNDLEKAKSFVTIWRAKGYICSIYKGKNIEDWI